MSKFIKKVCLIINLSIVTIYCLPAKVLAEEVVTPPTVNNSQPINVTEQQTSPLQQIQLLRKQNQIEPAKTIAIAYLREHPNDVDIMLLLGLMYYDQKDYTQAKNYLNAVLIKVPTYMDARIGLINVLIAENKYSDAQPLINEGLKQDPNNSTLTKLRANIAQAEQAPATIVKVVVTPSEERPIPLRPSVKCPAPAPTSPPVAANPAPVAAAAPKTEAPLKEIQRLREAGDVDAAKQLALNYFKANPDNVDIMLLLGLIDYQQKNYIEAEEYLNTVLLRVPNYVDARVGLVRVKMAKSQYQDALDLIGIGLTLSPNNIELLSLKNTVIRNKSAATPVQAKTAPVAPVASAKPAVVKPVAPLTCRDADLKQGRDFLEKKQYQNAIPVFYGLLDQDRSDNEARIGLTDAYLGLYQDMSALHIINQGLVFQPYDTELLVKKGQTQSLMYRYPLAADAYHKALCCDPGSKAAYDGLKEVYQVTPYYTHGLNEIGVSSDNTYVSDLAERWNYSTLYYSRDTDLGRITTRVNYASRLQNKAPQYELDFSPRFNRYVYFDLSAAYANNPVLFPKYFFQGEGYFTVPGFAEISAGTKYSNIGPTNFSTYTASIDRYFDNAKYWAAFRPYYFVPKEGANSVLLTATVRRYFCTTDHYIGITAGTGHSPDLADLQTVNFLVVKNNFINGTYEFPILNHLFVVDLGGGFQRWVYPNGLIRKLYTGTAGIKYRF